MHRINEMTKVATESIQFPYNQGVIWPQGLQTGNKSRTIISLARCPVFINMGNVITLKAAGNLTEQQWLRENDKPENFLVLNGNNDEAYVAHVVKLAGSAKHLQFITSGFGGHSTTDRHHIAVNQTEASRFKEILVNNGVAAEKIYTDHFSINSGQNSINVADILNNMIRENKPCNKIIIAGTPAAVFHQTYTYAQQLNIPAYAKENGEEKTTNTYLKLPQNMRFDSAPVTGTPPAPIRESDKQFAIESFPFADSAQYTTTADDLAVLSEFSTTHELHGDDSISARG